MKLKIILFIGLLVLLLGASGGVTIGGPQSRLDDVLQNVKGLIGFVLIGILIGGIVFSVSKIIGSPRWEAQGKDIVVQSLYTLLLVLFFMFIYQVFSEVIINLFSALLNIQLSSDDPYEIARRFLIWNYVSQTVLLDILTYFNIFLENILKSTISVPIEEGVPLQINFDLLSSLLGYIANISTGFMFTSFFINTFQILFISFVEDALLRFLLPLGVILRFLPFSRKAGSVLIAMGLGLYTIAPLVYLMDMGILSSLTNLDVGGEVLGYVNLFYNDNVLSVVVGKQPCGFFEDMYNRFLSHDYSVLGDTMKSISDSNNGLKNCLGISDMWDVLTGMVTHSTLPFWVFGGGVISISAVDFIASLANSKGYGNLLVGLTVLRDFISGTLMLLFLIYSIILSEIIVGYFIIVSVILPFLNLTVVILFMREFSLRVLDTPLSLGHLERLI